MYRKQGEEPHQTILRLYFKRLQPGGLCGSPRRARSEGGHSPESISGTPREHLRDQHRRQPCLLRSSDPLQQNRAGCAGRLLRCGRLSQGYLSQGPNWISPQPQNVTSTHISQIQSNSPNHTALSGARNFKSKKRIAICVFRRRPTLLFLPPRLSPLLSAHRPSHRGAQLGFRHLRPKVDPTSLRHLLLARTGSPGDVGSATY